MIMILLYEFFKLVKKKGTIIILKITINQIINNLKNKYYHFEKN